MARSDLRPVGPDEAAEPIEEPQAAHEVARRLLVEAESHIRSAYSGTVEPSDVPVLAQLALGWATLALTEPRE